MKKAAKEFPAVVLTGPRQSGKTTLLRTLFGASHRYVSLEPPDVRAVATEDPRGFMSLHPAPVIFDEIQCAPALLPYIKENIDAYRDRKGQFLVTGSQNLLLMERVTETLAGRAAMLKLLPLSRRECDGRPDALLPWERPLGTKQHLEEAPDGKSLSPGLWSQMLRGGYPELVVDVQRDPSMWFSSYIQTYLERDVRTLRHVGDLTLFQNFLRAMVIRNAQLLDITALSRDLGVAVNTIKAWISVLEASYQVIVLRPYFVNASRRLVKSPKVYFTDLGILCHLSGLKDPAHAFQGPMGGALFETLVFLEIFKTLLHRGEEPRIYFWRTSNNVEVDFVVDTGKEIIPIEVKLSSTPHASMAVSIKKFRGIYGEKAGSGFVVHPGAVTLPLGDGIQAISIDVL